MRLRPDCLRPNHDCVVRAAESRDGRASSTGSTKRSCTESQSTLPGANALILTGVVRLALGRVFHCAQCDAPAQRYAGSAARTFVARGMAMRDDCV